MSSDHSRNTIVALPYSDMLVHNHYRHADADVDAIADTDTDADADAHTHASSQCLSNCTQKYSSPTYGRFVGA